MRSGARVVVAACVAAAAVACSDQPSTGSGRPVLASVPFAPAFEQSAPGGPQIVVDRIRGVLRNTTATDSTVAEGVVVGDSAILEFANVRLTGDSALFALSVSAFDKNNNILFAGAQSVTVKAGANQPAAPSLTYAAADAAVATLALAPTPITLDWAGAKPGDLSCLNRVPSETAKTEQQVLVTGRSSTDAVVPDVRVGWRTRDSTVASVDSTGLIRARCGNQSTYVVARTFLGVADSVRVSVTAPPFSLLMSPESTSVSRGADVQMNAQFVDEDNNPIPGASATWTSSDPGRATVSASGVVHGIANGRVLISARSGSRQTIGVIQVVRPVAQRVTIAGADSLGVGGRLALVVSAFDNTNTRIPDASGYHWSSLNGDIATVSSSGTVLGAAAGNAAIVAALDAVADTIVLRVIQATSGGVSARVLDAATGAPLSGVFVSSASNPNNTVSTGADGRFTLYSLTPDEDITFVKDTYAAATQYNVAVRLGEVVALADVPLAIAGGTGTVNGHVVNVLDDSPLPGATVKLFPGIDPRSADPGSGVTAPGSMAETTTDANGAFSFPNVPSGTYTVAAGASGYFAGHSTVASVGGAAMDAGIFLSPSFSGSGLRVVLTWGDCNADANVPCDLDSHLTGPASAPDTGRFHIAYYARHYVVNGDTVALLDNDATGGIGPETVTLRGVRSGTYKYYVHDYTDGFDTTSTRLSALSHARVQVYSGAALVATFYPPSNGAGTLWAVFEYDGSVLTPVNQMVRVDVTNAPADFIRAAGSTSADPTPQIVRDLRSAPRKP